MKLNEYQNKCNRQDGSVMYKSHGLHNEEAVDYCILALCGEAGEVAEKALGLNAKAGAIANKFKKVLRGDPGKSLESEKKAMAKELGGVLWYSAMLAMELGFTLEEIALLNLQEIDDRLARGTLQGDGDNR